MLIYFSITIIVLEYNLTKNKTRLPTNHFQAELLERYSPCCFPTYYSRSDDNSFFTIFVLENDVFVLFVSEYFVELFDIIAFKTN